MFVSNYRTYFVLCSNVCAFLVENRKKKDIYILKFLTKLYSQLNCVVHIIEKIESLVQGATVLDCPTQKPGNEVGREQETLVRMLIC